MDRALLTTGRVIAVAVMAVSALALVFWVQHIAAPPFGDIAWYARALPALLGNEPLYDPATLGPTRWSRRNTGTRRRRWRRSP